MADICKHLKRNRNVSHLSLKNNQISNKGVLMLQKALWENFSLQEINLDSNRIRITTQILNNFIKIAQTRKHLKKVYLRNNVQRRSGSGNKVAFDTQQQMDFFSRFEQQNDF